MATLREYFEKDAAQNLCLQRIWDIRAQDSNEKRGEVIARIHLDFEAHAKYISFYVPQMDDFAAAVTLSLNNISELLTIPEDQISVQSGRGAETKHGKDLIFTGQVYIYTEGKLPDRLRDQLAADALKIRHTLTFRSSDYVDERKKWEKPLAFISHDSRDKQEIAQPLALKLAQLMCPVWYDEFSLKIGDSLRTSIEGGLKECRKCILLLTPNFLANTGWSKREYDSIFTREIVEKQRVILPVWHEVSAEDVYKYSPILADRVAANWSLGVDETARRLLAAINYQP